MKIRLLQPPHRGLVIEHQQHHALRLIAEGLAQPVDDEAAKLSAEQNRQQLRANAGLPLDEPPVEPAEQPAPAEPAAPEPPVEAPKPNKTKQRKARK